VLTARAKYALRAVLALAESGPEWESASALALRTGVPRKFLESILLQLRAEGVVESRRGSAGGHRLAEAPARLTVARVIRVTDGPLALTPCASATRFEPCEDCVDVASCRIRHVMLRARDAVAGVLDGCSIEELAGMPGGGDGVA
jgi:Rrf2 family protein